MLLSRLTYECTQFTPRAALACPTAWSLFAPSSSAGMYSPSVKVRWTMYRGMVPSFLDRCAARDQVSGPANGPGIGSRSLYLGRRFPIFRVPGRLLPAAQAELGQDGRHVVVHGFGRDAQALCNLLVAEPLAKEGEDVGLPRGEPVGVSQGGAPPGRDAQVTQSPCRLVGRRPRAEPFEPAQRLG